jgi:DNA modification methylase
MKKAKLMLGDNIESLKKLPENSIDSIVTDGPYGLTFMNKKWDYDVPSIQFWQEVYRVLKPGGHVLSFGGTRTYHRMVVNMEDAGFEIRDQIMWLYGSGFPKSHNIGKSVDKFGGNNLLSTEIGIQLKEARTKRGLTLKAADELFCGGTSNYNWLEGRSDGQRIPNQELFNKIVDEWPELKDIRDKVLETEREILGTEVTNKTVMSKIGEENESGEYIRTKGQSEWEGWGSALKPANEPICLARKPLSEKSIAENVLKWGTGGINVDGCRINYLNDKDKEGAKWGSDENSGTYFTGLESRGLKNNLANNEGRFPANIILDEIAAELLDEQSGISKSSDAKSEYNDDSTKMGFYGSNKREIGYTDKGGASRFFYQAKVSKAERNMGLDEFDDKKVAFRATKNGSSGEASKGMERFESLKKNNHPTVKPVALMTYLCRLITPPNGIVLDPFMGSGSTGISALLEGFRFCGMEMDSDYFRIAEARISSYEDYRKFIKK